MPITFTRLAENVIINNGTEIFSIPCPVFIRTESRMIGKIIFTENLNDNADSGIILTIADIEGIAYNTTSELIAALAQLFKPSVGVCDGYLPVTPSDDNDLAHPGFIECLTASGNIKFTDVNGNTNTKAFELNDTSKFRVKRVFSTDTTATGIVVYY